MGCHAIDEYSDENDVALPNLKTFEYEPSTSWFDSDFLDCNSSRKRVNSSPLPDAKRRRIDDGLNMEQGLSDNEFEKQLESMWDQLGSSESIEKKSSDGEMNDKELEDLFGSVGDDIDSSENETKSVDGEMNDEKLEDFLGSLGDDIDSSEKETKSVDADMNDKDFDDLFVSVGNALDTCEGVQMPKKSKVRPKFTIRKPGIEANGTTKRLVGSNGAPSIFYLNETTIGGSVAEKPVMPVMPTPPPPPHHVIRLKLKIKENLQPLATLTKKSRKIIVSESQSKKFKCTAEFFAQFLAKKALCGSDC